MLQTQNMIKVSFIPIFLYCLSKGLGIAPSSTSIEDNFEIFSQNVEHLEQVGTEAKESLDHAPEPSHLNKDSLIKNLEF